MGEWLIKHAREIGAERRLAGHYKLVRDANPYHAGTDLYQAFVEGWNDEGRRIRVEKKRRLIGLRKLFHGDECPACGHHKPRGIFLCQSCWPQLPARTRRVLEKRDRLALARLYELLDAIVRKVSLDNIVVAESRLEYEVLAKERPGTNKTEQGRLF